MVMKICDEVAYMIRYVMIEEFNVVRKAEYH